MALQKLYCDWDGILWRCLSEEWALQKENCDAAIRMPGRKHCMFLRDSMRCDNIETNKGRPPAAFLKAKQESKK